MAALPLGPIRFGEKEASRCCPQGSAFAREAAYDTHQPLPTSGRYRDLLHFPASNNPIRERPVSVGPHPGSADSAPTVREAWHRERGPPLGRSLLLTSDMIPGNLLKRWDSAFFIHHPKSLSWGCDEVA